MASRLLRTLPWIALAVAAGWLVWFPYIAEDADLFYHLNAGRHFASTGAIQSDSFYSFLSPPRPFVDYYWLFQALVYGAFSAGGFYALLVFRAVVFAAVMGLSLQFLWSKVKEGRSPVFISAIFGLVAAQLLDRMSNLRPHVFSYLLLVTTLGVLESKNKKALFALPLIAALWANLHGIEYPVFLLLVGAYFAEEAWRWLKERTLPTERRARLIFLAASPLALLVSPYGWKLFPLPFISSLPSTYITELSPGGLDEVLNFSFSKGLLSASAPLTALVLAAAVLAVRSCWLRTARLSHLLLLAGGAFLLTRGIRFTAELPLLLLPLLRENAPNAKPAARAWLAPVASALLLTIPLVSFFHEAGLRPNYPLSRQYNHTGITTFLRKIDVGGKVLHRPDRGGFLAWELYPRYQLTSDMQSPFLFNEEDMYVALNVFHEPLLFADMVGTYRPDFLVVQYSEKRFLEFAGDFPRYVPIFFDDLGVLFVDQELHPELAQRHALGRLNPFFFTANPGAPMPPEAAEELEPIAARVLQDDPHGRLVNAVLFSVRLAKDDALGALRAAESIVANSPNLPDGYPLRGRAAATLGLWQKAADDFAMAIKLSPASAAPPLYVLLGRCLAQLGKWDKTYEALAAGVLPYQRYAPGPDLELLAMAAQKTGREKEAELYRRFAQLRAQPE